MRKREPFPRNLHDCSDESFEFVLAECRRTRPNVNMEAWKLLYDFVESRVMEGIRERYSKILHADISSQSYERLFRNIKKFAHGGRSGFCAWFARVADNVGKTVVKKHSRNEAKVVRDSPEEDSPGIMVAIEDPGQRPEDSFERSLESAKLLSDLENCLEKLRTADPLAREAILKVTIALMVDANEKDGEIYRRFGVNRVTMHRRFEKVGICMESKGWEGLT